MRISSASSSVTSSVDERVLLKNSLYFELLFLMNLQPVLLDLHKLLFFALPDGLLGTLIRCQKEMPKIQTACLGENRDELDLALNKAALIRSEMLDHCLTFFSEEISSLFTIPVNFYPLRQALKDLEKELAHALTACWQNHAVQGHIKGNLERFLRDFEVCKCLIEKRVGHFKEMSEEALSLIHKEQMEKQGYVKVYAILSDLSFFSAPQHIDPLQMAIYLSCLVNIDNVIPHLIQTKQQYIDTCIMEGVETFGKDFPKILQLQKACLVHQLWIRVLDATENRSGNERGGWRYTYLVMQTLRSEKLTFYHHSFSKNGALVYAALSRVQPQTTIAQLEEVLNRLESNIEKKENALRCYTWEKAVCSFALLTLTKNVFFSLGKEMFIAAENAAPGTRLDEPYLLAFSHLAGGMILGGQIYLSPTVAGPALLLHAIAQALLSDTKQLKHYGKTLFGLTEDRVFEHYSSLLIASSFAVSFLTFQSEGIAKPTFQLGCSFFASHYIVKIIDHFYPAKDSNGSIKLISALAANALGFYLGKLAWQAAEDFAFDHFSNESLIFDDKLCHQFQKKCLKEAFKELGLDMGTPLSDIKAVYRSRSLEIHPDKNRGVDPLLFERLAISWKRIQEILIDKK